MGVEGHPFDSGDIIHRWTLVGYFRLPWKLEPDLLLLLH